MTQGYDDTDAMLNEMMARGRDAQNIAVRTREEQVADLVEALSDEVWLPDHKSYCEKMLAEAEARGAAEQRRKDAEGQKSVAWQRFSPCKKQWIDVSEDYLDHYRKMRQAIRCLYTHPANITALEARVKELEGAKLAFLRLVARAQMCVPELYEGWHIDARAAFKREGGCDGYANER